MQLRRLGIDVYVASIRGTERRLEELSTEELEEQKRTYYIKPAGVRGAIQSHLRALTSCPGSYVYGFLSAIRLGSFDLRRILRNFFYFVEAVMVGEWMKSYSINHVHIHFSSMIGLILSKIYPITMSITIHGPDEFNANLPIGWCLAEKVKAAKFVCVISNYGRSQVMRTCNSQEWDKIEVSPLGVNPSVFSPRPFREWPAPFEVICVARLASAKAQHVLIKALDRIIQHDLDVQLRLVGDGPDRSELEQEVSRRGLQGRVVFEGWLNQERVRTMYQKADLFALSSFAEGVPVVLMEAMAMEIPCVATWVAGIPELIRNEIDGLLVAPSNEEELATAIMRLMRDPALRRRLGQAGRQRVLKNYDLLRNTARLASIFQYRLGNTAQGMLADGIVDTGSDRVPLTASAVDSEVIGGPDHIPILSDANHIC